VYKELLLLTNKHMAHLGQEQWLNPVILAIWEAEMRRIAVQGQLGQRRG
jgi:hypothetical protein